VNTTLVLNIAKSGNNITFIPDEPSCLTFNFTVEAGRTALLSILPLDNVTSLLVHVGQEGAPSLEDVQQAGIIYPHQAELISTLYAGFTLSSNIPWANLSSDR